MNSDYLLKVAVIQLVAYGAYRLLLDGTHLHTGKRWYLLLTPFLAFLVPLVTVRTVGLPPLPVMSDFLPAGLVAETSAAGPATSLADWLLCGGYVLGVLVGVFHLLSALWWTARQRRRATRVYREDGAWWYGLDTPVATHSFGRSIFYYSDRPPGREVRAHELAHVRQRHTADRLLIRSLRVLWWFNPLLYLYERAIIHNHELLADTAAIRSLRLSPKEYQLSLLGALSGRLQPGALSSYLPFSFTKKRFIMLQHPGISFANIGLRLGGMSLVWATLLFAFGQTAYAQSPPPPPVTSAAAIPPPPPPITLATPPPPPPPVVPCPPPPPLSLASVRPYLDLTYGEWWAIWMKKGQEKNPGCSVFPMPKDIDPTMKMHAYLLEQTKERLQFLTEELQPITAADYKTYQDPSAYGLWLDGKRTPNAELRGMDRTRLYRLFRPSKLYSNAQDYGKYTYHLSLTSQDELDRQVARLKGEIEELR